MRLLLLALLLSPSARADNAGTTAGQVLQVPLGSRALGMGGAFTPVASDLSALYYNPAGLSRLDAQQLALTFMTGLTDNNMQQAAYGAPLPWTGFSGSGYSTLAGSLLFSQNGTIEVNQTNSDGSFKSSSNRSAGGDFVAQLGYAERVGTSVLPLSGDRQYSLEHFLGVSGKYIHSTLIDAHASSFTGDLGYLLSSPDTGLSLGLSALNVGGSLKYRDYSDPLPTTLRGGLAYQTDLSGQRLTLALDSDYLVHEKIVHVNTGLEYLWMRTFAARLGYQFLQDTLGVTAGFGLRWRDRIQLDYAWAMSSGLADQHRVTLTFLFGAVAPAERARERAPVIERVPEHVPVQSLEDKVPQAEPARPRPAPESRSVPGWIY